jgi:predicted Zn-dependent peptidase
MYRKTILENGVKIVSESMDHLKSVSLGIWVNTGSRDETKLENGVSHFIEHMSFKGTRQRNALQIAKELDAIGGFTNAFTGKENTCFHARVLGRHFTALTEILSDIFLNPLFDSNDIERERQVILQEISMVEDTPDDNIHELFNTVFWGDHPLGMSVLGTQKTVSAISKDNLVRYVNRSYVPEQIVVAAAGHVDHESIVSIFAPMFGMIEKKAPIIKRDKSHFHADVSISFKDLEQVHICLGGQASSIGSRKRFACAILNTILGGNMSSRLFQEIRENKGLAYSIFSFLSSYSDAGLLGVYLATDPANVMPALKTIYEEIRKLAGGELSDSDLIAAKDYLTGGIYLSSESSEGRMMRIAKNEFVFDKYVSYEEVVSQLEETTLDQVIEVARNIFRDDRVSLAFLGPFDGDLLDKSVLRFS